MSSLINNLKLNSSWTFYYHDPNDSNWKLDSYTKIYSFNTIQEFWALYNSIPEMQIGTGMFFIMRDNIKPIWEDPKNINGGCWSYKISKKDAYKGWVELSIALIGENIIKDTMSINGISISPKKGFCVIKIWNNKNILSDVKLLSNNIPYFNVENTIYKSFK